jgi:hypothetical protein
MAMSRLLTTLHRVARLACIFATLLLCANPASAAWTHGVYVWQRVHTPELLATLQQERSTFAEMRVLAAQGETGGAWATLVPDWQAWQGIEAALIPVLRLQGSQPLPDIAPLLQQIAAIRASWQQHGLQFDRIEIDFDCAESQLPVYLQLLTHLRNELKGMHLQLDVTALPSWLEHAAFHELLGIVDRVTLQVHAVVAPREGIFDAVQAERWIRRLDALSTRAFAVALPAYGARLVLDRQQQVVGVEHEAVLAIHNTTHLDIESDPHAVQALLQSLRRTPPGHLQQIQWFRLPLPGDERAWSLATLKAVMTGQPLAPQASIERRANSAGGQDVLLHSAGNIAAPVPVKVPVEQDCQGEGVGGYEFRGDGFYTASTQRMKPGAMLVIGWLRCKNLPQSPPANEGALAHQEP